MNKNKIIKKVIAKLNDKFVILDWAGNDVFQGESFKSSDEADEFLTDFIYKKYPNTKNNEKSFYEEKDEYQIMIKDPKSSSGYRKANFNKEDLFDIAQGLYWWLADNHDGQSSDKYEKLSILGKDYRPSPMETSSRVEKENDYYSRINDHNYEEYFDFVTKNL